MKLRDLFTDIHIDNSFGNLDVEISSLTNNSRDVRPGSLFICICGLVVDGHRFLSEAAQKGAVAGVVETGAKYTVPAGLSIIEVSDTRKIQGLIATNFYRCPAGDIKIIAVTGTNGKTTTTYLVRSILNAAGFKTALLGTIQYCIDEEESPAQYTTPDALQLQELFARMQKKGISHLVMEVSSHALALNRLSGCNPDVGIFTNLTRDHLDFHKDMEAYFEAKKKLFTNLNGNGLAVLNRNDVTYARLKKGITCKVLSYGFYPDADINCQNMEFLPEGLMLSLTTPSEDIQIRSCLLGRFNAYNIMAAVSCAIGMGIDSALIVKGIENAPAVPGRMERVDDTGDFIVVVDYAHTDDALRNLLFTCREFCLEKLTVVFGCGGDRDRGKRPRMGEVAGKLADHTILTSDNPRTEDPMLILNEIEKGIETIGGDYEIIPDRRQAIQQAIRTAERGDVVVLAGKGHEDYQIVGQKRVPFDDRLVAKESISKECEMQKSVSCNS